MYNDFSIKNDRKKQFYNALTGKFEDGKKITLLPFAQPKMFLGKKYVFYVNENKKTIVLKEVNSNKTIKIKCHPEDKFDVEIGIGLAISNLLNTKDFKYMRTLLRNKKNILDFQRYGKYCLASFFNFNLKQKNEFLKGKEVKFGFLETAKIIFM